MSVNAPHICFDISKTQNQSSYRWICRGSHFSRRHQRHSHSEISCHLFYLTKKKKLYEKTPACGAANRLYAQETAAHPLLSGVLVYGQHESLNKAKFLLMTMVQVGGRAEGMQCQMKCNVRLSLVLLLSQVDGAALLGAAVKEEGEITSHFGSLLLSNHWQGHTNVHTDTH